MSQPGEGIAVPPDSQVSLYDCHGLFRRLRVDVTHPLGGEFYPVQAEPLQAIFHPELQYINWLEFKSFSGFSYLQEQRNYKNPRAIFGSIPVHTMQKAPGFHHSQAQSTQSFELP